jgi:hypothetical protein
MSAAEQTPWKHYQVIKGEPSLGEVGEDDEGSYVDVDPTDLHRNGAHVMGGHPLMVMPVKPIRYGTVNFMVTQSNTRSLTSCASLAQLVSALGQ